MGSRPAPHPAPRVLVMVGHPENVAHSPTFLRLFSNDVRAPSDLLRTWALRLGGGVVAEQVSLES
jgi:hypothetical protein